MKHPGEVVVEKSTQKTEVEIGWEKKQTSAGQDPRPTATHEYPTVLDTGRDKTRSQCTDKLRPVYKMKEKGQMI